MSGASPVIDTSTTRVQQNFKMEQLQSIPNGRDMWALLAVTPAGADGPHRRRRQPRRHADRLHRLRLDRPGARADRRHQHHGRHRRRRLLLRLRVARRSVPRHHRPVGAKCRTPACRASSSPGRAATSSRASITSTGTTTRCRARTSPTSTSRRRRSTTRRSASTQRDRPLLRPRHQRRRPDQEGQDLVLRHLPRSSSTRWRSPTSSFDKTFDTKLWNPVGKGTYQVNQKNKLIGYYQWGQKEQPTRLPFAAYTYDAPEQTNKQDSGSWVYKAEWNGTVSDKLYVEARYGDFGYYFPLITNSRRATSSGATPAARARRRAPDAGSSIATASSTTAAATYFLDTRKGSHTFKIGARVAEGAVAGKATSSSAAATSTTATTTASRTRWSSRFPTATEAGKLSWAATTR